MSRYSTLSLFLSLRHTDGELFVGTVADFSGMDPLIYREPLRTEQYDATNLNGNSSSSLLVVSVQTGSARSQLPQGRDRNKGPGRRWWQ